MSKELLLLNDSPAGSDDENPSYFNHSLYATLLKDILAANRSGICLGFFARWGQGKSTVVNLLKKELPSTSELVIFNAYQARGDSVRRQMLLSVLRQIDPKKADDFEWFSQTTTGLEFATVEEKGKYSKAGIRKLLLYESKVDPILIAGAVLAAVGFVLLAFRAIQNFTGQPEIALSGELTGWLSAFVVGCFTLIGRKLAERKDKILAYTQPVSDSQRLKYPEQFSKVFTNAVRKFHSESNKTLIVVVDDLDRCDPGTVVEALASIRQFCHNESQGLTIRCQFLIPCDEGQMISALESDGYALTTKQTRYHNYSESEMLRKFFDVVVRMDEIVPESLAEFAAKEAQKIGLNPMLARDVVDAAGVREPRKIKSLLNALRVAQEIVVRNQAEGILPGSEKLDRLEYTLAALVSIQEMAPDAYSMIREDTDVLMANTLPKEAEEVAKRILHGLGPVSHVTADILITKQNEPSLNGLPQAHVMPTLVREDRPEQVLKVLTEADADERSVLLSWLGRKLRDARSAARIKQLYAYLLDYGKACGWNETSLIESCSVLMKHSPYLTEALRLGPRLGSFCEYAATLSDKQRHQFDSVILRNYSGGPGLCPDEEQYLLRFANQLLNSNASELRNILERELINGADISGPRMLQVAKHLPATGDGVWGFAPHVAGRVFGILFKTNNPTYHDACLRVGLELLGDKQQAANQLLEQVIAPAGLFNVPQQQINEEHFRINRVYFDALKGVLMAVEELKGFREFFKKSLLPWLNRQNSSTGRLVLVSTIQPGIKMLNGVELAEMAQVCAPWLNGDEPFAVSFIADITQPDYEGERWLKNRNYFLETTFAHFCNHIREAGTLTSASRIFLKTLTPLNLNCSEQAERLLADKIKRLSHHASSGKTNHLDEWATHLSPLFSSKNEMVITAVNEEFTKGTDTYTVVNFALKWLWLKTIPAECCVPFADGLLRLKGEFIEKNETREKLAKLDGFSEVVRILIKELPSKGAAWMFSCKPFMLLISNQCSSESKASAQFQSVVDILLTANNNEYFAFGLELLKPHKWISSEVGSSLAAWSASHKGDDPLRDAVTQVLSKPSLNAES